LKSNAGLRSNVWGSRFFSGDKDGQKRRKCLGQAAFFLVVSVSKMPALISQ
jgi:hypothetical protein